MIAPTRREWSRRSAAYLAMAVALPIALAASCSDENPPGVAAAQQEPQEEEKTPSRRIDSTLLPLGALTDLETVPLQAEAPCSQLIEGARPALEQIAAHRKRLALDPDNRTAPQILDSLGAVVVEAAPPPPPSETGEEHKRLARELKAAFADLAESSRLLAAALYDADDASARSQKLRIENGTANLRTTLKRLTQSCAP